LAPDPHVTEEEQNGIQWRNVGPIAGLFGATWILAFFRNGASPASPDRAGAALSTAMLIMVIAMLVMYALTRFLHHSRLSSLGLFIAIWAVAIIIWYMETR
jgi:hypothetical protein